MQVYKGRFCFLSLLTNKNDNELQSLIVKNIDDYRKLVFDEEIPESIIEFQNLVKKWFTSGRYLQFLVYKKSVTYPPIIVGTIFFYNVRKSELCLKCSCYFIREIRGNALIFESLVASILFVLNDLQLENCYFSVFSENTHMAKLSYKIGAEYIGFNDKRKTLNFKLSKEKLSQLEKKLNKLIKPKI